jgi:flagellar hook-basal body complex protein FliE
MALSVNSLASALTPNSADLLSRLASKAGSGYTALDESAADGLDAEALALSGLGGVRKGTNAAAKDGAGSFQAALLKAMDGVSESQNRGDDLLKRIVADPSSVDVQDVTIGMAEANMSLNLAKTILSRIVTAWKDVINTR